MKLRRWESDDGSIRLFNADCRDVLPLAELVDTVITDPPYDLTANKRGGSGRASLNVASPAGRSRIATGFMGKSWDGTGVAFDPATWSKVLSCLAPGGMLLSFGGTRTYHRMTCAIEDAGFEVRDCLCWLYGQGFPKSLDISKALDKSAGATRLAGASGKPVKRMIPGARQNARGWKKDDGRVFTPCASRPATNAAKRWAGYGTALKPAFEPIVVAMKPLDGTFAENALQHGVAGLNIDGGRIAVDPGGKDDARLGGRGQWDTTKAARNVYQGGYAGMPQASSALGRWPANVLLDELAGALLDDQAGPQSSGGTPRRRRSAKTKHAYGEFSGPHGIGSTAGCVSRFFYCPKASAADRRGSKHPTVKPVALIRWLCQLTTMPGNGPVLDAFMGSATTLEACFQLGRPFIGIEREPEYFRDAVRRAKALLKSK